MTKYNGVPHCIITAPQKAFDYASRLTIKLGTGLKIADDFRAAIKASGNHISETGNTLLDSPAFKVSLEEVEVELAILSNTDLGFTDEAKLKEIYARITEYGHALLPSEAGPQVLLQCGGQLKINEVLIVAMEPIVVRGGRRELFYVVRNWNGDLDLHGDRGAPNDEFLTTTNMRFIARRHK